MASISEHTCDHSFIRNAVPAPCRLDVPVLRIVGFVELAKVHTGYAARNAIVSFPTSTRQSSITTILEAYDVYGKQKDIAWNKRVLFHTHTHTYTIRSMHATY